MKKVCYRVLDHTADTGIEITGADLKELFCNAAMALTDMMVDLEQIGAKQEMLMDVSGDGSPESLLVCWLNEIIYQYETKKFLLSHVAEFNLADKSLSAKCRGEFFDGLKHPVKSCIKAATYHALEIKREGKLWKACVILDV